MSDENGNGIRITNREIFDMLQKVERRVARLEIAVFGTLLTVGGALGKLAATGRLF